MTKQKNVTSSEKHCLRAVFLSEQSFFIFFRANFQYDDKLLQ